MIKTHFVFAVSFVALMAVCGGARAEIAGVGYVDQAVSVASAAAGNAQTSANNAQSSADAAQASANAAQTSADLAAASAKTANDAIAGLDFTAVGSDGSYIKTISQTNGKVSATKEAADTTPTSGSKKMITSGGVYTALAGKQATLAPGTNIKGSGSVSITKGTDGVITVSGTDNNTTYSTGNATTSGLTKLYTGTGDNTDGTMTQAAITSQLSGLSGTAGDLQARVESLETTADDHETALSGKQATLTTSNIKGSGSVSVAIADGVITVSGTDNNTTYSTGTASTSGLTKLYTGTGTNTDGTMTQSAITTALNGKLSTSGTAAKATADASGNTITSTYATKTALSDGLATKQATLTTSNIKGSGSVSVAVADGVITVSGTDTNTTYSTGTASTSGLTKLYTGTGTNTDGTMTQSAITTALNGKLSTSGTAAKATADASGNNIVNTYATKTALSDGLATKQATLTTSNIKGSGSVSVAVADGVITVSGTDTNTTYSTGTASTSGLTKLYTATGSNTDGTMTQSAITSALGGKLSTTGTAAKATADASGNNIVDTYATKAELSALSGTAGTLTTDVASLQEQVAGLEDDKQAKLTAGTNITISGSTISSKDTNTTYSAGTNISLSGTTFNVATGTPSTLGVVKVGQIPSGSATSTTYATIWVE